MNKITDFFPPHVDSWPIRMPRPTMPLVQPTCKEKRPVGRPKKTTAPVVQSQALHDSVQATLSGTHSMEPDEQAKMIGWQKCLD